MIQAALALVTAALLLPAGPAHAATTAQSSSASAPTPDLADACGGAAALPGVGGTLQVPCPGHPATIGAPANDAGYIPRRRSYGAAEMSPRPSLTWDLPAGDAISDRTAAAGQSSASSDSASDWSIVTSPNTVNPRDNVLSGMTCMSASDCWAVGYSVKGSVNQTLIERWDGTSWAIVASPNTGALNGDVLNGVTCVSASDCWAVGISRAAGAAHTLIEHWNGTLWAVVASPNTSPTRSNELWGVTCVSASDCWAVGLGLTDVNIQTLIERWDGTSWAIVPSPNGNPVSLNWLYGVTCVSASNCWAVGYYYAGGVPQTLIERWNGTSWAIVISPNGNAGTNILYGVTCTSASDCWAAGYSKPGNVRQTLIERWNGTLWTIVTSPNTSATQDNVLSGVTCASASGCFAVGAYYVPKIGAPLDFIPQTLVERWNGTSWAIVTSPNISAAQSNPFYAVTCVSASDCWAVGNYLTNIANQTLIERWNGTSWAIVTSPNTSPQNNLLHGVTCASASDCWAVGFYYNPSTGAYQTLIERWDGTSWAIVTSPNTSPTRDNVLYGVTCASASDCWAVGYYYNGSADQTLIERWDGTSWAIVTSPSANPVATQNNYLFTVTCASASDCWAVGFYYNPSTGVYQTLIERWNGTSWVIVTSPNAATQNNFLYGVTCASASDCWAVGFSYVGSTDQTLIERWDGTSWAIVTSPNAHQQNVLYGVTCASASDCWAVGFYDNPADGIPHTLIERWDGTAWAIVTSPNTSATQENVLRGVTCVSASNCWAVGWYRSGSRQTLTMKYTVGSPPNLAPTARMSATPTSGTAPLPVAFDASTSTDPDSADTIASYTFNFGDASATATQAGATTSHTYTSAGTYTATVTVKDNHGLQSANTASVMIEVTLPPAPAVSLNPASLTFGDQTVGTTSPPQTVTLTNSGSAALNVGSIAITGTNATEFVRTVDNCDGQTIAAGSSCSIDVAFAPTTSGSRSASLTIPSSAPSSPNNVALTGSAIGLPAVTTNPASVAFGSVFVGANKSQSITLTNSGAGPLTIGTLSILGVDPTQFQLGSNLCNGVTLAPTQTCTFQAKFVPTTSGDFAANVTIPSNALGSPHTVPLTGTGVLGHPIGKLTPTSVAFGSVIAGQSSAFKSVALQNSGTGVLTVSSVAIAGADAAQFIKLSDACTGKSLSAGASCTVTAQFRPTGAGDKTAGLTFTTNAAASPHIAALTGTGLVDAAPPETQFTTEDGDILFTALDTVTGTVTDDVSGVTRVMVSFSATPFATTRIASLTGCNATKTACNWSVNIPTTIVGPTTVQAFATDALGKVEDPPQTIGIVVI